MQSRKLERRSFLVVAITVLVLPANILSAAGYRTANFVVEAPNPQLAQKIGDAAEQYRHDLAIEWIGQPLPRWSQPCPITAEVAPTLGAGGATSFVFDRGEVFNWTMTIQGSEERILDSVLPHEVTHTIFASHFRQPLPRWADEGACTTVEHPVERARQHRLLIEFLRTGRGISFPEMFAMKEYPADVLPLYSQGYSLARYLIERGGRKRYIQFVGDGLASSNWPESLSQYYGIDDIAKLQNVWLEWVKRGCPAPPASVAAAIPQARDITRATRGQSPDEIKMNAATRDRITSTAARQSIYVQRAQRTQQETNRN
ncbi:MAG: hypothetical protein VYA49_10570 [Planctomycetota bacterium]|nr:hypothetical protein [Planctomycetota bacterium]|tara:strand:+ start:1317 stop:2261 length:945 start_codon:yes stop_codon:yes gene_type:complete